MVKAQSLLFLLSASILFPQKAAVKGQIEIKQLTEAPYTYAITPNFSFGSQNASPSITGHAGIFGDLTANGDILLGALTATGRSPGVTISSLNNISEPEKAHPGAIILNASSLSNGNQDFSGGITISVSYVESKATAAFNNSILLDASSVSSPGGITLSSSKLQPGVPPRQLAEHTILLDTSSYNDTGGSITLDSSSHLSLAVGAHAGSILLNASRESSIPSTSPGGITLSTATISVPQIVAPSGHVFLNASSDTAAVNSGGITLSTSTESSGPMLASANQILLDVSSSTPGASGVVELNVNDSSNGSTGGQLFVPGLLQQAAGGAGFLSLQFNSNAGSNYGQVSAVSSSRRYKTNIKIMQDRDSEQIYKLVPVEFVSKSNPHGAPVFGLIAEMLAEQGVFYNILGYNAEGLVDNIDYQQISIALLKEFIKLKGNFDIASVKLEKVLLILEELVQEKPALREKLCDL